MRGFGHGEIKASKSRENNEYLVTNCLMLRFRPIAPKPVAGDLLISGGVVDQSRRNGSTKTAGRTKRRYVRVRGRQNKQLVTRKTSEDEKSGNEDEPTEKDKVTLQLLPAPERSEDRDNYSFGIISFQKTQENTSKFMYRDSDPSSMLCKRVVNHKSMDSSAVTAARSVAVTWIIVERVTDAYADTAAGVGLGFSDREKIDNLETDACPGFISDCTNKVVWVNEACRKMIYSSEEDATAVRLVVKEKLPHHWPSFACRVRLMQQGPKTSTTVACDVWRMENAGFAWKLDVTTALGLRSFQ